MKARRLFEALDCAAEISGTLQSSRKCETRLPVSREALAAEVKNFGFDVVPFGLQTGDERLGAGVKIAGGQALGNLQALLTATDLKLLTASEIFEKRRPSGLRLGQFLYGVIEAFVTRMPFR